VARPRRCLGPRGRGRKAVDTSASASPRWQESCGSFRTLVAMGPGHGCAPPEEESKNEKTRGSVISRIRFRRRPRAALGAGIGLLASSRLGKTGPADASALRC
jgi:hypothetical protein